MNAISPIYPEEAADRTARHMRHCADLADLAMQLARLAAAKALAQQAEPASEPPSTTAPESQLAAPREPASAATPPRAAGLSRAPTCKSIDPALLFTRLAAIVRACITLESRLAAGLPANYRAPAAPRRADPRAASIRDAFHRATENHPKRTELRQEFEIHLEEQLSDAEAHLATNSAILYAISVDLDVDLDPATLPDGYVLPPGVYRCARSPP